MRLDNLFVEPDFDLIKSDLQGADILALSYGRRLLSRSNILVIECEFIKQFRDGPLFWEVAAQISEWGFEFHSISDVGIRPRSGFNPDWSTSMRGFRQWLWGNAIFIRRTEDWVDCPAVQLAKFAAIMDLVFKSYDAAYSALSVLDCKKHTKFASQYASVLQCGDEFGKIALFKVAILGPCS